MKRSDLCCNSSWRPFSLHYGCRCLQMLWTRPATGPAVGWLPASSAGPWPRPPCPAPKISGCQLRGKSTCRQHPLITYRSWRTIPATEAISASAWRFSLGTTIFRHQPMHLCQWAPLGSCASSDLPQGFVWCQECSASSITSLRPGLGVCRFLLGNRNLAGLLVLQRSNLAGSGRPRGIE